MSQLDSAVSAPTTGFRIFYDKPLTRSTPYTSEGSYFRLAKSRIEKSFDLVANEVRGKDVLDVGASPFYLLYLARRAGAASCHGTYFAHDDHPLKDTGRVYTEHGPIEIHHSNIEIDDLPFADDSFDVVTACEILEHLEYFPSRFVTEVCRVLRPGGLLCVTVPNVCRVANIAKLVMQKNIYMPYRADSSGRHKHEYTRAQLVTLVEHMRLQVMASGSLAYSTSPNAMMRSVNRVVGQVPGLRGYAPVVYALARQATRKESGAFATPPRSLYTEAKSIED